MSLTLKFLSHPLKLPTQIVALKPRPLLEVRNMGVEHCVLC